MSEFTQKATRRVVLLRTAGSIIAVGLLVFLLATQGWEDILSAISQVSLAYLALALGLMFVSRFAISARWHILLIATGIHTNYRTSLRITFAGLFASNFLPTTIGGDVIRFAGAVQEKFDPAISAASLIVDRLVGMLGMGMMVPFGLPPLIQSMDTDSFLRTEKGLMTTLFTPNGWAALRQRARHAVHKVLSALAVWLKSPQWLLASLALTWVHMVCLFAILQLMLGEMGAEIPIMRIGGLYALVYFLTLMPISINGYGLQEISLTLIFSKLGNIPLQSSLSLALLFRTLMMVASLPGALTVPGLLASKSTPFSQTD